MGSKNLLALRAELDEQTKEIQKLQNEVEKATQNTINQLSMLYQEKCYKPSITSNHNAATESSSLTSNPSFFSSASLQTFLSQHTPCTGLTGNPEEAHLLRKPRLMQNTLAGAACSVDISSDKTLLKDTSSLFRDTQRSEQINHFQGLQQAHVTQGLQQPYVSQGLQQPHVSQGPPQLHVSQGPQQLHVSQGPQQLHVSQGSQQPHVTQGPQQHHASQGPQQHHASQGLQQPHVTQGPQQPHVTQGLHQPHVCQGLQQPHVNQPDSGIHWKIQELMRERARDMDTKTKSSISHEQGNKLDVKVQELETTNVIQEEMLKQARAYTELLKEKVQKQDRILQDTHKAISDYKKSNKKSESNSDLSNLGVLVVQTLQELSEEVSLLKGKVQTAEDQIHFLKGELSDKEVCLKQFQESHDNLVNEHEQERALLAAELNAVRGHAESIQAQLETSQDQSVKHAEHIANLESKVSQLQCDLQNNKKVYKDKVEELRNQLSSANGSLEDLRKEHVQCKQEYGGQLLQLNEALKTCEKQLSLEKEHNKQLHDREMVNCLTNENLRRELVEKRIEAERLQAVVNMVKEESQKKAQQQMRTLQEKTSSLNSTSSQLESIKDAMQKTSEELAAKSQRLDLAEKTLLETRNLLAEKDKSFQSVTEELKKVRLYAESKKREVQHMKADNEKLTEIQRDTDTIKLLLVEKDNMIGTLRGQIDAMAQMTGQQNQKADALEEEKSQLLEEVAAKKSEVQNLVVRAEKKEKRIAELEELCTGLELEKSKQANLNTKNLLAAKKMKKEREEMVVVLKKTQSDLESLAEDYENLKRQYESETGDKDGANARLKMQLKAAIAELEQTKNTLNTVEDCDGHTVRIATRMQKKITAKRKQIDMLQSRVHFLEEALANATKDKHTLKAEKKKLMQECVHEASGRHKLSGAVEILMTENNTLKDNVRRTKAALEKTLLQLSECQAVNQLLEQESMRLRLQHTLDLQELKRPGPDVSSRSLHRRTTISLPHSTDPSHPQREKQVHVCDVINISQDNVVKTLEDIIHLPDSLSPFKDGAALNLRKNANCLSGHDSKEPIHLYIADLEDKSCTLPVTDTVEPCRDSSPEKNIPIQEFRSRSPVHCLLTAPASNIEISQKFYGPNNDQDLVLGEPGSGFVSSKYHNLQHRLECLQTIANDLQMKNKEMSSIFEIADENIFM